MHSVKSLHKMVTGKPSNKYIRGSQFSLWLYCIRLHIVKKRVETTFLIPYYRAHESPIMVLLYCSVERRQCHTVKRHKCTFTCRERGHSTTDSVPGYRAFIVCVSRHGRQPSRRAWEAQVCGPRGARERRGGITWITTWRHICNTNLFLG